MKGKFTRTTSRARTKGETDFRRLREMSDASIDDSDIPRLGKSFWKTAKLRRSRGRKSLRDRRSMFCRLSACQSKDIAKAKKMARELKRAKP